MQPPLTAGIVLQNRYRLLGVLGQGGFGRTYLAEDLGRFNERCALKEYIPPQSGDYALQKSQELFQREAAILYQIQHPQIPQFRATFQENQRLFLVQDYVNGKTYRDLLNERKAQGITFSEAEVLQLMRQLLPVLAHIHAKGIIHRDIAPDNIMLRQSDYLPVLIDFGVVKEVATRMQNSETAHQSTTVGKLGYAPSEQMQTGRAYPSSDLYALAVTAVVLLTGREPQELFDDVSLTWHWQRYAQVSPGFAQVINKMLSYRPGDRYQSVAEVAQALQPLITPNAMQPPVMPGMQQPAIVPPLSPSPVVAPNSPPDVSQMRTVAIGRQPDPATVYPTQAPQQSYQSSQGGQSQGEPSVWDNPWAVLLIGMGLAVVTGIGSWAVVSALYNTRNSPTPVPTLTATPTPTPTPTATPTPDQPVEFKQQLDVPVGSSTTARGSLRANQTLNYTIAAEQGQFLTAVLDSDGALLTVLAPDGKPANEFASGVTRWEGTVDFNGDYVVQVRPDRGVTRSNYALTVSLTAPTPTPIPTPEPSPEPGEQIETQYLDIPSDGGRLEIDNQVRRGLVRQYVVSVQNNQQLRVELLQGNANVTVRFPGGAIAAESGGSPIEIGPDLPESGNYLIDVSADQTVNFVLGVSVRSP
ncbi:MAG TPA: serine/threonine protein kinase [Synechococcales cyanobacterium M55_K2018_004]|nr:serine/threonine protein kinase [Synechococcales cyanobacterium M55_K2018_004]